VEDPIGDGRDQVSERGDFIGQGSYVLSPAPQAVRSPGRGSGESEVALLKMYSVFLVDSIPFQQ
jgi:hypothetical protein